MAAPEGQQCSNCRFYRERDDPDAPCAYGNPRPDIIALCVRFPPVLVELRERMGSVPGTVADWWCGEWRPEHPDTVEQALMEMARFVVLEDMTAARAMRDKSIELDGGGT